MLTLDGVGEWATTSVGLGSKNRLEMIREIHFPVHFTDAGSRAMATRVSDALLQAPTFRRLIAAEAPSRTSP